MSYSKKKLAYWRSVLAEYVSSGLKPVEFCQRNHLVVKSFYKWRLRLSDELPEGKRGNVSALALVPVATSAPRAFSAAGNAMADGSGVTVEAGGTLVHLSSGFDASTFLRVLDLVGRRPC